MKIKTIIATIVIMASCVRIWAQDNNVPTSVAQTTTVNSATTSDYLFNANESSLDLRVTRHFGFFVDARYVMPEHVGTFGVGRAGLRLTF